MSLEESHYPPPEILTPTGWNNNLQAANSPRDYHGTAVLLPDARIFVGGGENRTGDYEIFSPPYLTAGLPRPINVRLEDLNGVQLPSEILGYDSKFMAISEDLPLGTVVNKVCLIAPGSTTHHSDMSQRYHEMTISSVKPHAVKFTTPIDDRVMPRGFYMLWMVTNIGTPSNAVWIQLQ